MTHQTLVAHLHGEVASAYERGRADERSRCWDIVIREAGVADDEGQQDALMCAAACIHSEKTDEIMRTRRGALKGASK